MPANNRRLLAGFARDSRSEIQAVPCFSDGGVKIQKCIIVGPFSKNVSFSPSWAEEEEQYFRSSAEK